MGDSQPVNLQNKDAREVGAECLCKQAFDQLGVCNFLQRCGWVERKQPLELLKVKVNGDKDQYLWVKIQAKQIKEDSMSGLLTQRFEQGLTSIQEGISKKGGTKTINKVHERIGKLK